MAEKKNVQIPSQQYIDDFLSKPENRPGKLTSAALGFANSASRVINTATGGYFPTLTEYVSGKYGVPAEAVDKLVTGGKAQNPKTAGLSSMVGYAAPVIAGTGLALELAAAAAPSLIARGAPIVMRGAPKAGFQGPPTSGSIALGRTLSELGKASKPYLWPAASVTGTGLGAVATGYALGGDTPTYKDDPAADPVAAPAAAAPKEMSSDEFWAARLGVQPGDVAAIRRQYGGIPMSMITGLSQSKPAAPGYKDEFADYVIRGLESQAAAVEASGDKQLQQEFQSRVMKMLMPTLGNNTYLDTGLED